MAGPTFSDMATAVDQLVAAKRQTLHHDEEMTRALGIEPGPDLAFAGVRVMVKRCEAAAALLRRLAPHQAAVMAAIERAHQDAPATPPDRLTKICV